MPNNVWHLKGDEFFQFIRNIAGETLCEILQLKSSDSTQLFLNTPDLFDVFKHDSFDINHLRDGVYFKTESGDYIRKSGIITNVSLLINLVNAEREQQREKISVDLIDENPLLGSLI